MGLLWVTGDRCFGLGLLNEPPEEELELDDFPATGELEYFRTNPDGDSGAALSFVFVFTLIGRDTESGLIGILSGGPIGLSSRLRFRFLSFLLRSSERLLDEPEDEAVEMPLLEEGFLSCELPGRSVELGKIGFIVVETGEETDDDDGDDDIDGELIGVMVIDDLRLSAGADWMGIISIPSRRSRPVSTEPNPDDALLVIGVMLTDEVP